MNLVGVAEIAGLLGVSKQTVANWKARKSDFPKPAAELRSGPVWDKQSILDWAEGEGIAVSDDNQSPPSVSGGSTDQRTASVVALMNMKGGVGKSTMAANMGWYAAHQRDFRVLLVDLDPQFNLSQYILGVNRYEKLVASNQPTIETLFRDGRDGKKPDSIKDVIVEVHDWDDDSCIHLVPANLELAWSMKNITGKPHVLRDYLDEVKNDYDLIILDCAPTESPLSTAAYMATDYIFVPVRPEFLSTIGLPLLMRSLDEFAKDHRSSPVPELGGIIFNDTSEKVEHDKARNYVQGVAAQHKLTVFENEVSHSDSYPAGSRAGKPIFMTGNARKVKKAEFNRVAEEFLDRIGL